MLPEISRISSFRCFGGYQRIYSHFSEILKCKMNFSIYIPPQAEDNKVPVLYWLSGLTCTEQNFIQKAGAQRYAAEHGVIIVGPDTSPRGCNIEGEDDSWDLGTGAGFYINATEDKWKNHYKMYSYVTEELPDIIIKNFPVVQDKQSIFGHSMGGHGALICALKNPGKYCSVSALAPICNPVEADWGKKAFTAYLGENTESWKNWDATHLVKKYNGPPLTILIDQGSEDEFLNLKQLLPENFVKACSESKMPVILRMQEGYDHSYYFISSFISDHIAHHMQFLKK
ncbi:S-formylglutathione hydrolase-like [Centruroides sculpturatus]|uniref:S-formylglutathione hydrolase-like n=1 Tax=Centruroides sculpturatus TaxID=218467 RepID=UPI000C6CEECA|nr:S-formylglutathione hydrolase-like [Centruroides sculpturatus]